MNKSVFGVCTCVQPLRNSARKPVQPLARASMPSRVIWSHHDRFNVSSILQPSLDIYPHYTAKINRRVRQPNADINRILDRNTFTISIKFDINKEGYGNMNTWEPWGSGCWRTHRRWDLIVWALSKTCWGWRRCCLWFWYIHSGSTLQCFCSFEQMS